MRRVAVPRERGGEVNCQARRFLLGRLRMRLLSLFAVITGQVWAQSPSHPLDSLTTAEYWTVYDILQKAGHVTPETFFASVLLHPPAKTAVLSYRPGQPFAREADVVLLRGEKTFAARVDIVGKKVLSL